MMASSCSSSSTRASRDAWCAFMPCSSLELRQDLAAEQLDRLVELGDGVRHEEHPGKCGHARLLVDADALAERLRAADQVALLIAAGLLAQGRGLQRLEMLVELRATKPP